MPESRLDPVTFEVIWHRLLDLTEEMGIKYMRTSGSQVLLTGYDASTGITLPNGDLVAMGPYITTQGNVLPLIIDSTIRLNHADPGIGPGDMFMCNDPFLGATHGPDVATVAPVHHDGELVAWVGASGHWLDIGGIDPGGFCIRAVETHEEGLRMPAIKLVEGGRLRADVERWIMNQVRDPLTGLDIRGQIAANNAGRDGLEALFGRYGLETVRDVMHQSIDYAEQRFRERLRSLPDGEWREIQYIDHDGHNDRIYKIVCRMTKRADSIEFDFSETDTQAPGFINCTFSGLRAGILSALYILLGWDLPWNQGISRCVKIVCPPGLIVNAQYPAPTSMATIGVIILVIDTVFRPLSQLLSPGAGAPGRSDGRLDRDFARASRVRDQPAGILLRQHRDEPLRWRERRPDLQRRNGHGRHHLQHHAEHPEHRNGRGRVSAALSVPPATQGLRRGGSVPGRCVG